MPMKRPGGGPSGAPKRTRIVDPAESSRGSSSRGGGSGDDTAGGDGDQFLDGDITEANRGARKREKRALKDTDGYGSDSSDDEEGVVPSRRPGAKEDEDEDMDMFADEPKDKEDKEKKEGKSKDKEFMALDDVEGQEFARPKPEEDSDSEDEGKKKGAGLDGDMGELTPFNMKAEMQEGRFSKDGETYEENSKDPHDRHDNWLDSLDKDAIKKARRAHRERERVERERQDAEDNADATGAEREQSLMRGLIPLMERGETVLEAMQRLGTEASKKEKEAAATAGRKKKSWAERQKERKEAASHSAGTPFAQFSNIVSDLTAISQLDVYALSREAMQRMLPREDNEPAPALRPPTDTRRLEYRFSLAYVRALPEAQRPVEREVFGPFSVQQLNTWKSTGFFGPQCENVEVRLVGGEWGQWTDVVG